MRRKFFFILILMIPFTILIYPKIQEVYILCRVLLTKSETRYDSIFDLQKSSLIYFVPEDIYLDYLLEREIPSLRGPEGNEVDLDKPDAGAWLSKRGWEVLKKNREKAIPILIEQLENFDNSAALVLGYLKVEEAIPLLRRAFIKDDYFYGWEGNSDIYDPVQYTHHYCYEEALEHITNKRVKDFIRLTDEELKGLEKRRGNGEEAAAYVLYRLAKDDI